VITDTNNIATTEIHLLLLLCKCRLRQLREAGLQPDAHFYDALIDALQSCGQLHMAEALYKWGAGENRSCSISGKSPLLRHWSFHTAGVLELQRFKRATAQAALRAVLHDMRDAVRCSGGSDSSSSSSSSSDSGSTVPHSSNSSTTTDSSSSNSSTGSRRQHRLQRRRVHDPTQPLHIIVRREQQWCDALLGTLDQFSIECEPLNSEGWIVLPANSLQQFCTSQQ
jgi:hypothetical protein